MNCAECRTLNRLLMISNAAPAKAEVVTILWSRAQALINQTGPVLRWASILLGHEESPIRYPAFDCQAAMAAACAPVKLFY